MKNKIFLLTVVFIMAKCYSQDFSNSQISNPTILPPDVSSFQKVNFLPVSNYTGRANIEIPFYSIDLGGIKIPIGLSYNTSGVKLNDVASSVGLNWSLNAGGMISKMVRGIDDFSNDYLYYHDIDTGSDNYYEKRLGFLSYNNNHPAPAGNPTTDDIPDDFIVNAPGINLKYIHNRGDLNSFPYTPNTIDGVNQNGQYINLTDTIPWDVAPFILNGSDDYKIDETYGNIELGMFGINRSFTPSGGYYNRFWLANNGSFNPTYSRYGINSISIKNDNGFQYIFDKIDSSQYVLNRDVNETNKTITYNDLGIQSVMFSTNINLVGYHLSKIIDLKTNKFVEFQYETYTQTFSEIIDNNVININYTPSVKYAMPVAPKGLWNKFPKLNRLKKIIFDNGTVEFGYNLDRQDVTGEKALTDITLYDKKNNQIKKAVLNFGYFQSPLEQTSPFSKRLKLNDISIQGSNATISEKYRMTYNTTPLSIRIMAVTDAFGYNNGSANNFQYNLVNNQYTTTPNPIAYFHPNKGQNSFLPEPISANAIYISGNYSLTANLNYCKSGILERIDYPTGGYTTLDYELNSFKLYNYEIQGGGLRVKEQKISEGNTIRTLKFEYKKTDGTSSGAVVSSPKFIDFDYNTNENAPLQSLVPNNLSTSEFNSWFSLVKNNFPKQHIELTNGCFVGYSRVKVFEDNKGYSLFEYTSPSTYPDTQADFVWFGYTSTPTGGTFPVFAKILLDNGKLNFVFDNDVYRGKLLNQSIFNQQHQLLTETSYQYTDKLFKSMLAVKTLDNIYQKYGWLSQQQYESPPEPAYQYGYFKQRRFLLTNVVEKEYFNGQLITKNKDIEYDDNYSLVKKEYITDNLNSYRNEYYYPFDVINQSEFGMSNLIQTNRNSEKIRSYSFKNNEKVLEEKTVYSAFSSLILPKQIKKFKSGSLNNSNEINSVEITLRDNLGNICEVTDKIGKKTSFIWGYNQTAIIAKIENASYSSISPSILSSLQSLSISGTELQLMGMLDTLRGAMTNAFTTSYTYKPLVGISTIIDPKGDVLTYQYDVMGRLKSVRDKDNNIISENDYHYKPQN